MRKTFVYIFAAIAAVAALSSCNKELNEGNAEIQKTSATKTITVSMAGVKTTLGSDNKTPQWAEGDKIMLSNGTSKQEVTIKLNGEDATIETTLEGGLTAVYPSTAWSDSAPYFTVSAEQDGSFAKANICKAEMVAGGNEIVFENQTALFKFVVPANTDEKGVAYTRRSSRWCPRAIPISQQEARR